jgi:hypothetical protein
MVVRYRVLVSVQIPARCYDPLLKVYPHNLAVVKVCALKHHARRRRDIAGLNLSCEHLGYKAVEYVVVVLIDHRKVHKPLLYRWTQGLQQVD